MFRGVKLTSVRRGREQKGVLCWALARGEKTSQVRKPISPDIR